MKFPNLKEKKQLILYMTIVVLAGMVFYQGYLLNKNQVDDFGKTHNINKNGRFSLLDSLKKKFKDDSNTTGEILDDFFNDDFFKGHNDPFYELESMRKRMMEELDQGSKGIFDRSWEDWYGQRFGDTHINLETEENDNEIIMRIKIPGLESSALNIDIRQNHIRLECDITKINEKKDPSGNSYIQSSSQQHISKIFPTPPNADTSKATVDTKEDEVIIKFPKV